MQASQRLRKILINEVNATAIVVEFLDGCFPLRKLKAHQIWQACGDGRHTGELSYPRSSMAELTMGLSPSRITRMLKLGSTTRQTKNTVKVGELGRLPFADKRLCFIMVFQSRVLLQQIASAAEAANSAKVQMNELKQTIQAMELELVCRSPAMSRSPPGGLCQRPICPHR